MWWSIKYEKNDLLFQALPNCIIKTVPDVCKNINSKIYSTRHITFVLHFIAQTSLSFLFFLGSSTTLVLI